MNMINDDVQASEKRDRGFTLVELLIVIVILGILATVTVFAVRGITDKGQKTACAADKKTLEVAVESYFAQNAATTLPGTGTAALTPGATNFNDPEQNYLVNTAQLLRSQASQWDVSSSGSVTALTGTGSKC